MTKLFFTWTVLAVWALLMSAGCTKEGDCFDPDLKAELADALCAAIYDPVCGCDGNTYGNSCDASRAGIRETKPGACDPE